MAGVVVSGGGEMEITVLEQKFFLSGKKKSRLESITSYRCPGEPQSS